MSNTSNSTSIQRVPVVILNGFLGSGKTTLLRSLLVQAHKKDLAVSVVVNDMSELDVDGELIAETEMFGEQGCSLESIHACVLSSEKGINKLHLALENILSTNKPDLLIVETSGSCHPLPLIEYFQSQVQLRLTGVLTLVDSAMLEGDYNSGQHILPMMQHNVQHQLRDTTNLLVEQIMFCSHLVLTKADRITDNTLQVIAKAVHELNPFVSVMSVLFGNLAIDDVLAMPDYDYHRVAQLIMELKPALAEEYQNDRPYDLATRVIKDERPFHPQRLWETCQKHLGQQIYRSKGFFYLASRDQVSLLWNQAAAGINLELIGSWRSGILEDPDNGLDEAEIAVLKERLVQEGGRFGDRHCNVTVIGHRSQVDVFVQALVNCFLTEAEIEHWQAGGTFPDPWPESIAEIKH